MRRKMFVWVMMCLFLSAMAGSSDSTAPVPEPMTCLVLMAGLFLFCLRAKNTTA